MKYIKLNQLKTLNYDVIIVGAGPVGCVLAERFSNESKLNCLIIEQRNHIAGNCYDLKNNKGLLYHKYGPHYLRFKNKKIYNYLSNFTKWINGNYVIKIFVKNQFLPFPINLTTLEKFFKKKFINKNNALKFLEKKKIHIKNPKTSEEFVLSNLGKEIYENFYKNYTIKQWGRHPNKLHKSIVGRIPIRFNRDNKYVNEKLQKMPKHGYTKMFQNMISNKKISVLLNTNFYKIKKKIKKDKLIIYCGTPDSYFNYIYGKLEWRSLKFKFKNFKKNYLQKCVQYNYPNNFKFTRRVEIKHVTKQKSKFTVISTEYPTSKGDPYYPINDKKNSSMFNKYKKLIKLEEKKNVFFVGRLANYKYYNTDQVVENALNLYKKLKKKF